MGIETEIKLRVPPGARAALEQHPALRAVAPERRDEVTTYFDTQALTLARQGFILRIRRSNGDWVQTAKSAGTHRGVAAQRGEWEAPVAGAMPELERLAATPVGAALARLDPAALRPVITTQIARTAYPLRLDGGTSAELVLDEGHVAAAGRREPVSELEIELKQGAPGPLYRLALELAALAPLVIEPVSKAERGVRLCTGAAPTPVIAASIAYGPEASGAEALHAILGGVLGHLLANLAPSAAGEAEGVHQLRVSIRRLRSALDAFRPLLHPEATDRFDAELRRLGRVFGEARDWDVFIDDTLAGATAESQEGGWLELLRDAAERRRVAAYGALRQELDGPALTPLMLGMAGWIEDGVRDPALLGTEAMSRPIGEAAPALLHRMARKVARRGRRMAEASPAELHALRKSIKRLRYTTEFFACLYPERAVRAYLKPCKTLQTQLGLANDATLTPALAERLSEAGRADLAPAIGLLASWTGARAAKARRRLPKQWSGFRDTRPFWS